MITKTSIVDYMLNQSRFTVESSASEDLPYPPHTEYKSIRPTLLEMHVRVVPDPWVYTNG